MRFIRSLERFHIGVSSLGGIATMLMVLTILPDVLTRYFFKTAINGVSELNVALLIVLVFAGLAGTQAQDAHFRLGMIDTLMGEGRALKLMRILGTLIAFGIFALMTWATAKHAYASTLRGEFQFGRVGFPVWPMRICIAAGFALLTLQLVLDLVRILTGNPKEPSEPGSH